MHRHLLDNQDLKRLQVIFALATPRGWRTSVTGKPGSAATSSLRVVQRAARWVWLQPSPVREAWNRTAENYLARRRARHRLDM